MYKLPCVGKRAIELSHFPSKHQAFIFRASEYFSFRKIAEVLRTTEENVRCAAFDMGLPDYPQKDIWMKNGYITIIRRMWHILPYEQLLELLGTDEKKLAEILRQEDFLDIKLSDKPLCEIVQWRELTDEEIRQTRKIREIMEKLDFSGVKPFDFRYNVPEIKFSGEENFETRILYLFSGLYQNAFDTDSEEYCSDELLDAYKRLGINGLWTQGTLTQLTQFPFAPEISEGFEKRLSRMKKFVKRLSEYGIKLYLYLNEPRFMPEAFFEKYPHLKGHVPWDDNACLCTSVPEVREYLKNAVGEICRQMPEIGGFFTITRSENPTNCHSHSGAYGVDCNCPRCKNRTVEEVIGEAIKAMADGAHSVDPKIKFFAWSWGWNESNLDIIRCLPKDVILLSQSELDVPFSIGGVKGNVIDYSMSIVGPGERAKSEWLLAKKCGLETAAKLQINTTWEASTVPSLPVAPSVSEHIKRIKNENVRHLLLSWTLGGFPGLNIFHAAEHFYENCEREAFDERLLSAQKDFAEAFREFPFHIDVLYMGPQNAGPSNLLYEKPTGFNATMTCFSYDDLDSWRGIYPVEIFEQQWKKLCDGWEKGLKKLNSEDNGEISVMGNAAYCLFKSSLNQIRFIRARDAHEWEKAAYLAEEELKTAEKMLFLMNKNASIGFEAANHYYFSKGQLAEKIINCHYISECFRNKKSAVNEA